MFDLIKVPIDYFHPNCPMINPWYFDSVDENMCENLGESTLVLISILAKDNILSHWG